MGLKLMSADVPRAQATAAECFARALAAGSTDPQNFELLATFQVQSGKTQDAIATIQLGLQANPYSPRLYRVLAALYVAVNAHDDALKTMKKDLELFPEDSYMRSLLKQTEDPDGKAGSRPSRSGPRLR